MKQHTDLLEEEMKEKLRKAKNLKKEKGFFMNFFSAPDFYRSAELFSELGDYELSKNNYEKAGEFYITSAETYLCSKEYGNKAQALYSFSKAGDALSTVNELKAMECYENASLYASITGNYSVAATKKMKAYEIQKKNSEYEKALQSITSVVEFYTKAKMEMSKKMVNEELVLLLLIMKKYEEAGHTFLKLNCHERKYYFHFHFLCSFLCFFLCNEENKMEEIRNLFENESEEQKIVEAFYSEERCASVEEKIDKYIQIHVLKDEVKNLFIEAKNRVKPEFDIL